MGKVFTEGTYVPPQLSEKVKNARLQVELCADCISLNEMFSKLCRKLEKIEMEIASCVGRIHLKLELATGTDNGNIPFNLGDSNDDTNAGNEWDMLKGKEQIVKILRSEILKKCVHKMAVANSCPRVKVQRLTMKQVDSKRSKIKLSPKVKSNSRRGIVFSSHTTAFIPIGLSKPKREEPEFDDPLQLDDDIMGNINFGDDYQDPLNEDEGSIMQQAVSAPQYVNSGYKRVQDAPTRKMYTIQREKYSCTGCSKQYSDHNGVTRHYKTKHENKKYRCVPCGKIFDRLTSLHRHNNAVHKCIRFNCAKCSYMSTQKANLNIHMQRVHSQKKVKCRYCSKLFASDPDMRNHIRLNSCSAKNGIIFRE